MKTFIKLALFLLLVSACIHIYLSFQHYPLKLGFSSGPSICSLNSTFDCDAVAASSYSEFLGIPLSIWGVVTNLIIFISLLLSWLQWSENPERLKRFSFALASISALASCAMAFVSFAFMSNYCLFCMALYVLSFFILFFIYKSLREPFWTHIFSDVGAYFSENRGILALILAIPILSFVLNRMALTQFGAGELSRMVYQGVKGWSGEPKQSLSVAPLLTKGPEASEAKLVISEFADFRCGHCKHASHSLHAFTNSHPDVRFEFYVFPLDGACNPSIQNSNGLSCLLAKAVFCAEKQGQGWAFHDILFQYQDQINEARSPEQIKEDLNKLTSHLNLDRSQLEPCLESPDTQAAIEYQSQQGSALSIQGTPTIFANGKLLQYGQTLPVLEAVYEKSRASKAK